MCGEKQNQTFYFCATGLYAEVFPQDTTPAWANCTLAKA